MRKRKKYSNSKRAQEAQNSKRLEHRLEIELMEKLDSLLEENDSVLLEVNPKSNPEFLNILDERVTSLYSYEQVDQNKFIFRNKQLELG